MSFEVKKTEYSGAKHGKVSGEERLTPSIKAAVSGGSMLPGRLETPWLSLMIKMLGIGNENTTWISNILKIQILPRLSFPTMRCKRLRKYLKTYT